MKHREYELHRNEDTVFKLGYAYNNLYKEDKPFRLSKFVVFDDGFELFKESIDFGLDEMDKIHGLIGQAVSDYSKESKRYDIDT